MAHHGKVEDIEDIEHTENVLKPTASQFEQLYLQPEQPVAGVLRQTYGNPTPIALAGFVLANTPATMELMGWHGAGAGVGNAGATVGSYYYLGAILLFAGGIGEWILGNTFPAERPLLPPHSSLSLTDSSRTFGATLTPFYGAVSGYGDSPAAFYDSFATFLIAMGMLCFFYMIASIRTNICLFVILLCFCITFPCLTASYYYTAAGSGPAKDTLVVGGAFGFAASLIAWYLWFSMILQSVDFPIVLPVGDLSRAVKGRSDRLKAAQNMA